jgi:hypothetical protein
MKIKSLVANFGRAFFVVVFVNEKQYNING